MIAYERNGACVGGGAVSVNGRVQSRINVLVRRCGGWCAR